MPEKKEKDVLEFAGGTGVVKELQEALQELSNAKRRVVSARREVNRLQNVIAEKESVK